MQWSSLFDKLHLPKHAKILIMTEHQPISLEKYQELVDETRELTSEEMEVAVGHIRYGGEHDIRFRFSTNLGDEFDAVKLAHYAAILKDEVSIDQLKP